jgi:hypothetical protein
MFWFAVGFAVFMLVNFALTLCFMKWGLTPYSYDERFKNDSKTDGSSTDS